MLLRRGPFVDDRVERRGELDHILRCLHRLRDVRRELAAVGLFLQELDAVLALGGGELVEIDEHRRTVILAGLNRERAPCGSFDGEAHHGLIDGADLLDVESAIGEPFAWPAVLPSQCHQAFKNAEHAAVRHIQNPWPVCRRPAPLDEREHVWIEQLAAASLNKMRTMPAMDEPKQG